MLTKLGPQKPAVDIIIGQMVYISSTTEKSFHPVLFLKVADLMISKQNQAFSGLQFCYIEGSYQASAMKKSELDLHKMLWFKDTIQVR